MLFTNLAVSQQTEPGSNPLSGWGIGMALPNFGGDALKGSEPIVTVSGTVMKVEKMKRLKDSLAMTIKNEDGQKFTVWMGPRWFIVNQKIQFNPGDSVEVRGLQYQPDTIIASEISKGDWTMVLRSESDGLPSWECCIPRVHK